MTEIPDDVMKAAYDAVNAPTADEYGNSMRYYIGNNQSDMAVRVVARAILAERERCASICDSRMYDFGCISGTEAQDYVTICADLACEIRGINNS